MNLTIVGTKTKRVRFATAVLIGSVYVLGTAYPTRAATLFSTEASGNAKQFQLTCGTCPNPVTDLSHLTDGGPGQSLATVDFSQGSLVSYSALAIFTGPNSLPHLGARASADVDVVPPSTFFYQAGSVARATQKYTYTGATPTDYTLEYDLDGSMTGGILTEIAGGFTIFGSGFQPGQEVQPVIGFTFDHVNGDGTEKPVHLTGDVSFTVNPGDTFFLQATLDIFVDSRSQSMFASADALHTLAMSFTQGDPSLLIPAGSSTAAEVPEPGSMALVVLGLVGLGVGRLRMRRV
ncbi:MAG: PEP-CTERM sorting domain-containing protein [Paludibaculum sp.]